MTDGDLRPGESERERLDRNLDELLGGLRVALPGVQVLLAFLLVLPFQSRYELVTEFQEGTFYVTLLTTALASVCFIGPTARHRLRFRKGDKEYIVLSANRLVIMGLGFLSVALVGAVVLVSDFIFGTTAAVIAGVGVGAAIGWTWFAAPLLRG
jgi:hypothetical protein